MMMMFSNDLLYYELSYWVRAQPGHEFKLAISSSQFHVVNKESIKVLATHDIMKHLFHWLLCESTKTEMFLYLTHVYKFTVWYRVIKY